MQDPAFDVLLRQAVAFGEAGNEALDFGPDHFGNTFVEENMEARIPQVETHGTERIGERVGFGDEDSGSLAAVAADEHGGGAVAEQNRRDQVGLRNVLTLKGERREFDGDNQDVPAGIGLQKI